MTDETEVQMPKGESCEKGKRCRSRGCLWVAVGLLLLLILIALLLPAISMSREAARRAVCSNNLKNIMVAMNNYHAKYGSYPPAYTVDKQGRRMHSWRVLLLEFLDRKLYAKYNFGQPWDSSENLAVAKMMKRGGPYRCPSEGYGPDGQPPDMQATSYVMLVGSQAFSSGPTGRNINEITDGLAYTISVVEMSPSGIGWTEPRDLEVSKMSFEVNDPDHSGIRSCHSNGAYVVFADGHTVFIPGNLKALTTINGKEYESKFEP